MAKWGGAVAEWGGAVAKWGGTVAKWGGTVAMWGGVMAEWGRRLAEWGGAVAEWGGAVAEWGGAVAEWGGAVAEFESRCGNLFASELWQFRLPHFASIFQETLKAVGPFFNVYMNWASVELEFQLQTCVQNFTIQ